MLEFKQIINKIKTIEIAKVFSLNAISTLIRMLTGLVSVKVVASIIGPAGVALLGQLNNISTILLGLANGGISTGVTKYVAEYNNEVSTVKKYISNAFRITLVCTLAIAILLILACRTISKLIMLSEEYWYVFVVFGFTLICYSLNALIIAILNGYKHFNRYVIVNICGTIFGLIFTLCLVSVWGLPGALINAVTFQSMMIFVTIWLLRKEPWLKKEYFINKFDLKIFKLYLHYSLMTIVTLAMLPVSQMLLRGYVISEISIADAGCWEGINRISNMYLSIITTSLAVYVLPRFSEIQDPGTLRYELKRNYMFLIPMLLCAMAGIFLLRNVIVMLLFTAEFMPMTKLFGWQLLGDFFKIASWLLSFLMVAKAQTVRYLVTEISFNFIYVFCAFAFLRLNGIVGLTQGYLITYVLYFLVMIWLYRNIVFMRNPN